MVEEDILPEEMEGLGGELGRSLYHAMSRSYDAALGRFQSRDVEEYLQMPIYDLVETLTSQGKLLIVQRRQ